MAHVSQRGLDCTTGILKCSVLVDTEIYLDQKDAESIPLIHLAAGCLK